PSSRTRRCRLSWTGRGLRSCSGPSARPSPTGPTHRSRPTRSSRSGSATAFPGAIHVSEETLQAMIVDVCTSLAGQGFPHVVLVNNHFEPEHVQTLHRSIDALDERGIRVGYLDLTRRERAQRLTEEFRRGECHAGRYETSLVLAQSPQLVDRDAMAALPEVPVSLPK